MTPTYEIRNATRGDLDQIVETLIRAFEFFRSIAPAEWKPPPADQLRSLGDRLDDPSTFCLIGTADDGVVGHVAFLPSMECDWRPNPTPGLAHLWQLFVRQEHWGSRLAGQLLSAAMKEAEARRFGRARLYAYRDQSRARRFYEREGWRCEAEVLPFSDHGLSTVEYQRSLSGQLI